MSQLSQPFCQHILLAEDDEDDRFLFKKALGEMPQHFKLTVVNDGEQLMKLLREMNIEDLPDVLFLDLNMPVKNGYECLAEMKRIEKLDLLKIIVFSSAHATSELVQLYKNKDLYFIRKPDDMKEYKEVICQSLHLKRNFPIS